MQHYRRNVKWIIRRADVLKDVATMQSKEIASSQKFSGVLLALLFIICLILINVINKMYIICGIQLFFRQCYNKRNIKLGTVWKGISEDGKDKQSLNHL